uniref:RIMS-binding protein 2 n=1 Tax=Callorhinchus milii TaxID=7868 RepID=A0A4W3JSU2_CALMI
MREAAERRQQLELEHEEALAVLNAKQQEIEVLQKAQVEAKKEHEGAVQLLEVRKLCNGFSVRELEEKCRNQSEQFNLLSKELEKFRQTTGNIDLLNNPLSACETPSSFCKSQCQVMNGLATSIGKGRDTFRNYSFRLCIARYSYNPYEGPNENPEAELPLRSGKYLYVYGDMDEDGFYEGELMDGRRGLVPSNFVALLQDEELLSFHSSDNDQDNNLLNSDRNPPAINPESESILQDCKAANLLPGQNECPVYNNGTGTLDLNIDEIGEDIVPYPRKITLIKQLAKSVIVGWEPPVMPPGWGIISSYNVLVNKEVRNNIPFGSRTKALIEKLNLVNVTYRISVQSVTDRGSSDELRCSLLVGENVCVAASYLKMDKITQMSAELSWLPSNSNYSHVIFLNEDEYDIVKAASYKYHFFNLKPNTTYKIKAVAEPHQVPWQLPLEQREKKEAVIEFCTLPAGPPEPPQDVAVQAGSIPGTIQVSWKPPVLSSTGTSNGATVTGYNVCTKGQRVAEVMLATAEGVTLDILRIQSLQTREVTVRTLSAEGESEDSSVAAIPPDLLVPPIPRPRAAPRNKPLASARAPDTKEDPTVPTLRRAEAWKQTHPPSPVHGHTLDPTLLNIHGLPGTRRENGRSPSPQRILPQPQGAPIPNTVAKAIAREAAQRVAETNRAEKRSIFSERSIALQRDNSDEEEEVYDMANVKRPGMSVDEFLKGSELGRQQQYSHIDGYHTESSRGSDLSDIMEEDEEELYSEMQLEEGVRRRHSASSHSALKILGNPSATGRTSDRVDSSGRRLSHGSIGSRGRPMTVPSIDRYCAREHLSPELYEESEPDAGSEDLPPRIFVALFDYDPLSMSPNPDAAEEELAFKEGEIIKVHGDKDADGFYHGETSARFGLIPCNMVSEIQTEDEEMLEQFLRQGFLPLNTPVEKIERNRRSSRQHSIATRRMVALYDYDPRESSPNVDVEAELTFCAGDIITVWGELDEDGFYYGEINGQKGLVPSNFLEEVPDDVEVYLSEAPSRYSHDTPMRAKGKRASILS